MSAPHDDTRGPEPRWEAFAAREPYFAVLTADKFLQANLTDDVRREFFASGEEHVDWVLRLIDQRLVPAFAPLSTLEYGCGVGRLAIPFGRRPGSITAVDRSPAMLATARREADRAGIAHIEFQTPGQLFAGHRRFDLVHCYGVLQRMPPAEGLELLRDLVDCLGSGAVGVFHLPCRATTSRVVQLSRELRGRVPVVNGVVNALRGKPFARPFIPTYSYDLDAFFHVIDDTLRRRYGEQPINVHLVLEHQEGFAAAIAFVAAPGEADAVSRNVQAESPIDVKALIAETTIEDLNRSAEEYFSSLTDWEYHLAKPFSNVDETPTLLLGAARVLQGLQLTGGMTVLEFGAGSGWLSRFLTQLGCRAILLDVSPSALAIARELYARLPIIGDRPEPRYLTFDGHRIDLPDASVDRILCFHAFHHVPNPEAILKEFGRVLTPGGIAGFAEPGSRHSRDPQSQFEMRAYGVVENDMDVHALWRTAQTCGFAEMKLGIYHDPPFQVSLRDFEAFLADPAAGAAWTNATRAFLRHVRTFFLVKEGTGRVDSRSVDALGSTIAATLAEPAVEHEPLVIDATVTNSGAGVWLPPEALYGGVQLGTHLYDAAGKLLVFDFHAQALTVPTREIAPGETVTCRLVLPPQPAGRYIVELDCVASRVRWFAQVGSQPVRIAVDVRG